MSADADTDPAARSVADGVDVPDPLLAPFVGAASELLVAAESSDVPRALRSLAGFDRRGLAAAAARSQILRVLHDDQEFRARAAAVLLARSEVQAVLDTWAPESPATSVQAAAATADLALLASALVAGRPPHWEFGLGLVVAAHTRELSDRNVDEERRDLEVRLATLEEARSRADDAKERFQREVEALGEDLRAERGARRDREQAIRSEADDAATARDAAARELDAAAQSLAEAQAVGDRLAERVAKLEATLRDVREVNDQSQRAPRLRREDAEALVEAASLAKRLSRGLDGVAERASKDLGPGQRPPSESTKHAPRRTRNRVPVPGGLILDSRQGLEAALRSPGVALVVDGYNVSMNAWGAVSITEQRERLVAALSGLQARTTASMTVVFDGADVGTRPARRPGVRVVFSPEGIEADAIVIEEVDHLALDIPVVVATSDRAVLERAAAVGAGTVKTPTLVALLGT